MKSIEVPLFGDIRELNYNGNNGRMEAIGIVSPTDLEQLLLKVAEAYSKSKTKRGKRIHELAIALAKDYYDDHGLQLNTRAYVATGKTIVLTSPILELNEDESFESEKERVEAHFKKVHG